MECCASPKASRKHHHLVCTGVGRVVGESTLKAHIYVIVYFVGDVSDASSTILNEGNRPASGKQRMRNGRRGLNGHFSRINQVGRVRTCFRIISPGNKLISPACTATTYLPNVAAKHVLIICFSIACSVFRPYHEPRWQRRACRPLRGKGAESESKTKPCWQSSR